MQHSSSDNSQDKDAAAAARRWQKRFLMALARTMKTLAAAVVVGAVAMVVQGDLITCDPGQTSLGVNITVQSSTPDSFDPSCGSLTHLTVYTIDADLLPNSLLTCLTKLSFVDLSYDGLRGIEADAFAGLGQLTFLNLNNNRLTSLSPDVFDSLTSLLVLTLWQNNLSSLPLGVFDSLTSLKSLGIGANYLTSLPLGLFDNLGSLATLYLHYNDLASLPPGIFDPLASISNLKLEGNTNLTCVPQNKARNYKGPGICSSPSSGIPASVLILVPVAIIVVLTAVGIAVVLAFRGKRWARPGAQRRAGGDLSKPLI